MLPGDAAINRDGSRFQLRAVKRHPELRLAPALRTRSWPASKKHPRAVTLRFLHRLLTDEPDALLLCARRVGLSSDSQLEGASAALITRWMRALLVNSRVGVAPGTYLASHSWRIMLISACDAAGIARDVVRRETLHKTEQAMLPYIRPFPALRFFRQYYDDLL
jgi:hypothetical protein